MDWLIDRSALIRLPKSAEAEEWATRIQRGLARITIVTGSAVEDIGPPPPKKLSLLTPANKITVDGPVAADTELEPETRASARKVVVRCASLMHCEHLFHR